MLKYTHLFTLIILLISCGKQVDKKDAVLKDKGIVADMLPKHIRALYKLEAGSDSAYNAHAKQMYLGYLSNNQPDSALFCLIAWHEVLDQNYIYDSTAMYWAVQHLKKGLGSNQNQEELLKLGYYIGSMYYTKDDEDSSIHWFNFTLQSEHTLPRTKVRCRTMLANTFENQNKMDAAIALKLQNLEHYRLQKDTINFGITSANISKSFRQIYAYNLSREYANEGLRFAKLSKDTFSQVMIRHALSLLYIEVDENVETMGENVYAINELMRYYSRPNLTLKFSQAQANFDLYVKRNNTDSMQYWLEVYKDVCRQRGGVAVWDYLQMENRLNVMRKSELTNVAFLKERAHSQYKNKEYKDAYIGYYLLMNDALNKKNYQLAFAYRDSMNAVNEILFETANKGKIYELEIKYNTRLKDQELLLQSYELKKRDRQIVYLIVAVAFVLLLFVIYLLWQKQRLLKLKKSEEQRYLQQLMEQTEAERKRIAQDLHDSLGHELLNLKLSVANKIDFAEGAIDNVIKQVRDISRNLFPVLFEEVGLSLSIMQLADKIKSTEGLYVITEIDYKEHTFNPKTELIIYRIIQEALTNTLKYAQAQSTKIEISERDDKVFVNIMDNGKGFDVKQAFASGNAFGLFSITKRCEFINAQLNINSSEQGTTIALAIPIKHV